jgi:hypothetical protein
MVVSTTSPSFWKIKTDVCLFPTWQPQYDCFEGVVIDWNQSPPVFHFAYNASALIVFYSMRDAAAQGGGMSAGQLDKIFQFFFDPPGNPTSRIKDINAFIVELSQNGLIETVPNEAILMQYNAGGALIPMKYVKPKIKKHGTPGCPDPGAIIPIPVIRCCG